MDFTTWRLHSKAVQKVEKTFPSFCFCSCYKIQMEHFNEISFSFDKSINSSDYALLTFFHWTDMNGWVKENEHLLKEHKRQLIGQPESLIEHCLLAYLFTVYSKQNRKHLLSYRHFIAHLRHKFQWFISTNIYKETCWKLIFWMGERQKVANKFCELTKKVWTWKLRVIKSLIKDYTIKTIWATHFFLVCYLIVGR